MRLNKFLIGSLLAAAFLFSCDNDDEDTETFQERDPAEQWAVERVALEEYLETHFYNYEDFENPPADFDYVVRFDTINEANADKIPLIQSDLLEHKTVTRDDIDYTIYILKIREGEGLQPTFADSTFVTYNGQLLNRRTFDIATTPIWLDLPGRQVRNAQGQVIRMNYTAAGMAEALTEFRTASDYSVAPDNTIDWSNDFGVGAVFMPSGLAYYSASVGGIPPYSPLVFGFQLLWMNEADHDGDGIPSYMEDLDGDGDLFNDDTDGDGLSNFSDTDDDGDFIPTREEITFEEDGSRTFPDTNGNGVPDYLDPLV